MIHSANKSVFVSIPTHERAERIKMEGVLAYAHERQPTRWHVQLDAGGLVTHIARNFRRYRYDGIIAYVTNDRMREALARLSCPMVLIEDLCDPLRPIVKKHAVTLIVDHFTEGCKAAQHLLARHFTAFAWVGPNHRTIWAEQRKAGFAACLAERGFQCHSYPIPPREARDDFALELPLLSKWLKSLTRPCAVFAYRDSRARQVITAADEAGIPMPEALSILGVNNDEIICTTTIPTISSVLTSDIDIGYAAGQMLDDLMCARTTGCVIRTMHPYVVTRRSTDAEAVTDVYVARALQYARAHLPERLTADVLSAQVKLPPQALRARTERALGTTLCKEIQRIRLNSAATQLVSSDKSVSTIANECGFISTSYLCQKMKETFGETPLVYKRSHRLS